jgi:hypothetical protein
LEDSKDSCGISFWDRACLGPLQGTDSHNRLCKEESKKPTWFSKVLFPPWDWVVSWLYRTKDGALHLLIKAMTARSNLWHLSLRVCILRLRYFIASRWPANS